MAGHSKGGKRAYNPRDFTPLPLEPGPRPRDKNGRRLRIGKIRSLADIRAYCVDTMPPVDPLARPVKGPCWSWTRALNHYGYPVFAIFGKQRFAHREAHAARFGRISPELVCDHLCRNPVCCNPEHIEPIPRGENVKRGAGRMRERERAAIEALAQSQRKAA